MGNLTVLPPPAPKEDARDNSFMIQLLESTLQKVKNGELDSIVFVAITSNGAIALGSETTVSTSAISIIGSIAILEKWFYETQIGD